MVHMKNSAQTHKIVDIACQVFVRAVIPVILIAEHFKLGFVLNLKIKLWS